MMYTKLHRTIQNKAIEKLYYQEKQSLRSSNDVLIDYNVKKLPWIT